MAGIVKESHSGQPGPDGKPLVIMEGKGKLVGWGTTGVAQLTSTGVVVKTPWEGEDAAQCRKDMLTEARVYQRLGRHPRLVALLDWDPEHYTLTLEYMPNGSLRDYLKADPNGISAVQRLTWAKEAAEGVQLLHSANVIHCDVGPRNFLVGGDLGLRIADFSGSSLDGSRASACPGIRFTRPGFDWRTAPRVQDDIFSLGSTIYTLIMGQEPFRELDSDEVETRYAAHTFPDVTDQPCSDIVQACWEGSISSAQEVVDLLAAKLSTAKEKGQFCQGCV
ncbi:Cytoplasmic tyrosine-protein kinase BMX [Colletotrichum tanaceti]|uniref:Cytoplasmic tyrosine-protein kinase BMX n=1 Tax=Colletotrichum tanaceti TaxID=1306861 RepID=A0A4U6XDA6_9PEZI|nr:Cytoplasmic tyrosine-protein kinase BMX [Colletotrichum tanaceti]TKW53112.1 Cytoplasmic tyrosine-protein kinase BMX [Colletotrichum tanaceti]